MPTPSSAPARSRGASSPRRSRLAPSLAAALLLGVAGAAHAQTPADTTRPAAPSAARADSLSPDSLAARLARAEAAIALLRQQLAEQSESAVRARSRLHVELSARVLTNAFLTNGRTNATDLPLVALPPAGGDPAGTRGSLGVTVRQTRVGAGLSVNDVLGGAFAADVDLDFAGGPSTAPGDRRLFPEPRLRTARARLVWARTELMIGSEVPLVSPHDPFSLAAVGTPNFSGAGNLWNWLPQLRVTRELGATPLAGGRVRWGVQGALLEPFAGAVRPDEPDGVDAGERSRRPFVEGRLRARWGDAADEPESPGPTELLAGGGEVGVGAHHGWVAAGGGALRTSRALTADLRVALGRGVELRGEGYVGGRLLRGLGGGAIGQAFGRPADDAAPGALGAPLRDDAGWLQLNVQPRTVLVAGVGCGADVVRAAERPARERNGACAAHLLWRPVSPLLAAIEYRRLRTRHDVGTHAAQHVNLAFGVDF